MRRHRKAKNPETTWLKYVLIAGAGYLAYRVLKSKGILGENGDDEYAPYKPGPVVKEVEDVLKKATPSVLRTAPDATRGAVTLLAQKKKSYDLTYERYKEAPLATEKAKTQYNEAQTRITNLKSVAEDLRNRAQAKGVAPTTARFMNQEAMELDRTRRGVEVELPKLKDEVRVKQGLEKLPTKQLRKLEGELTEAAKVREVNDFLKAELVVGEGTVDTE